MRACFFLIPVLSLFSQISLGQQDHLRSASDTTTSRSSNQNKDPLIIALNVGAFNVFKPGRTAGHIEMTCYLPWRAWFFYPVTGAFVTTNTSTFTYAGITIPILVSEALLFRISFTPGLYTFTEKRSDLGLALEFMTSLKIAYRFRDDSRLGLQLSHISNAGMGEDNPGSETLVISYELPFGKK